MNRPPRKKTLHKDDLSRDPRFDPKDLEQAKDLSQDDRNIVGVDDAFKEADVEDKVWLFWERNKNTLIFAAVAAMVAAVAVQVWRIYQERAFVSMQQQYQVAVQDPAELLAFGNSQAARPLGAFALLQTADARYRDGEYAQAAELYAKAVPGLGGLPFADRAQLGRGMSLIKADDRAAGSAILNELAHRTTVLDAVRAEAAFDLALLAMADKQYDEAKRWLAQIDALADAPGWAQQANMLRENSPELAVN